MQNIEKLLAPSVAKTIASLNIEDEDSAAAKLAETYAAAIDAAKMSEGWADSVLRKVDKDSDLHDEIHALKVKLAARTALSDYGPKLKDILVELGATKKSRAAMKLSKKDENSPEAKALSHLQSVMPDAG